MRNILCVILGGGRGTRLYPLTKYRSKPAVPLAGKYRLIDIPVSNCLNSGLNMIYVLTQFNSESLNKHITRTYKLDSFSKGFVEIMAAEQSMESTDWFQGTADAVRHCLKHFNNPAYEYILILSGDQLYKMNLMEFINEHIERSADVTVACNPVLPEEAYRYGIMTVDKKGKISDFVEKPKDIKPIMKMAMDMEGKKYFLASMGIYLFNKKVLVDLLAVTKKADFGREIIPEAITAKNVYAYAYKGYWQDIGTIKSFYEANLSLNYEIPPLNLYDGNWQIFTHPRYLPPSKIHDSEIDDSSLGEGCIVGGAKIKNSVIGLRGKISSGTTIEDTVMLGADFYESLSEIEENRKRSFPCVGIGKNCIIKKAILDKNVRIGDNVQIVNKDGNEEFEGENYFIRDGIVVIEKGAVIKNNTVI